MDGVPKMINPGDVLTPVKFASVIPDPCKAPSTSSRLALRPEITETPNTAWSACKFRFRDAVTVMEFESVWAEISEANAKSARIGKLFRMIKYPTNHPALLINSDSGVT